MTVHTRVGVKKMGQLDCKPFHEAMKKKYTKDAAYAGSKICSLWDDNIRDPHWHPFKVVKVEGKNLVHF